jgi:phosphoglycolate phosphatase
VDDFQAVYRSAMKIFEKFGAPRISPEDFRREFRLPYLEFYQRHNIRRPKRELDVLYGEAINSIGKPKLHKNVRNILDRLSEKNINMAILSSDLQEKLSRELDTLGLSDHFVAAKADVLNKIEAMENFLAECRFMKEETAYVGDMVHDIEAGKKAGVRSIAVTWGFHPREKLEKANPDHLIDAPNQLLEIIN